MKCGIYWPLFETKKTFYSRRSSPTKRGSYLIVTDTLPVPVDWKDAVQVPSLRSVVETGSGLIDPGQHWQKVVKAVDATHTFEVPARDEGLEASLFRNRADQKILASRVAMHLSNEERRTLFLAIDRLLDHAEWEDESSQIDESAFRSYLRFMIFARPRRFPNLGVGPNGTLLVGWRQDEKSVHAEFFPEDQCMTLVKCISARGPETIAWRGHVARLRSVIENNGAVECID